MDIVEAGFKKMTRKDFERDLARQKALFWRIKADLEQKYRHQVVSVCNGEIFHGDELDDTMFQAMNKHPGKPIYAYQFKHDVMTFTQ